MDETTLPPPNPLEDLDSLGGEVSNKALNAIASIASQGQLEPQLLGNVTGHSSVEPHSGQKEQRIVEASPSAEEAISTTGFEDGYTASEFREVLRARGRDPTTYVLQQVAAGVRVVVGGEVHAQPLMEENMIEILRALTEESPTKVGTLVLEAECKLQPELDAFAHDGAILPSSISAAHDATFVRMLEYARDNHINIICVDDKGINRDRNMDMQVSEVAHASPDTVTFFIVGNEHVNVFQGLHRHRKLPDLVDRGRLLRIGQVYISNDAADHSTLLAPGDDMKLKSTSLSIGRSVPVYDQGHVAGNYDAIIFIPKDKV